METGGLCKWGVVFFAEVPALGVAMQVRVGIVFVFGVITYSLRGAAMRISRLCGRFSCCFLEGIFAFRDPKNR